MGVQVKEQLQVKASAPPEAAEVLTPEALEFVRRLEQEFRPTRAGLLQRRAERQEEFDAGSLPDFLSATAGVRGAAGQVAPPPPDSQDRRRGATGPARGR